MKILLDTNILISRENNIKIEQSLADLMRTIEELNYIKYIHPLSISEIDKDKDDKRKSIVKSKLKSYPILKEYPDYTKDKKFIELLSAYNSDNGTVDNQLLYCIYKSAVSMLITEDMGIIKKAKGLKLGSVLKIKDALENLKSKLPNKTNIDLTLDFLRENAFNINLEDKIFDSLKEQYKEFENWWKKICEEGRNVFINKGIGEGNETINAILMLKIENEQIECENPIEKETYVKICLFKVANHATGSKLGEKMIYMAINYAMKDENKIYNLYLTHFKEEKDFMIKLIEEYGFELRGHNKRGEEIYTKKMKPPNNILNEGIQPLELNKKYFPSYCDGVEINKFLIPIIPKFHELLFPEYYKNNEQLTLFNGKIVSCGNSIKKAYICNSKISSMKEGDIIIFYRSQDCKAITTIGIIEEIHKDIKDPYRICELTKKRTVYSLTDIENLSLKKRTTIILFKQCLNFKKEVKFKELKDLKVVNGSIQKMQQIINDDYKKIIKEGNIDESFTIH